jgi:hypothetical protein
MLFMAKIDIVELEAAAERQQEHNGPDMPRGRQPVQARDNTACLALLIDAVFHAVRKAATGDRI